MREYHIFYQALGEMEMLNRGKQRMFEMIPETILDVHKNHIYLKSIMAEDLDDVYHQMQGEIWSTGDAQEAAQALVKEKGVGHTSMMIGDVILDNSIYWMVDSVGFKALKPYKEN